MSPFYGLSFHGVILVLAMTVGLNGCVVGIPKNMEFFDKRSGIKLDNSYRDCPTISVHDPMDLK